MSRFEDTLRRDLDQIADRATPSPDAWAQIQSRIADQEPDQETEIVMLTENMPTRRRWALVAAAAAAVVALVIAIAAVNRDTEPEIPADSPEPTPTGRNGEQTTSEPSDEQGDEESGSVEPIPLVEEAIDLALEPPRSVLAAGRYSVDMLGVPFEFEIEEGSSIEWRLNSVTPISFEIGGDGHHLAVARVGSLLDGSQSLDPTFTGLGSIPPDQIDTWLRANLFEATTSSATEVGGRDAQFAEVVGAPGSEGLGVGTISRDLLGPSGGTLGTIAADQQWVAWIVELGDFEPLAIAAETQTDGDPNWLAESQRLVDSIVLGEPGPVVEGGQARVSNWEPSPITYHLVGDLVADPSASATLTGDATGAVTIAADGTREIEVSADGLGEGTIVIGPGETDGVDVIVEATGDFAGATGSFTSETTADGTGTYALLLTMPAES